MRAGQEILTYTCSAERERERMEAKQPLAGSSGREFATDRPIEVNCCAFVLLHETSSQRASHAARRRRRWKRRSGLGRRHPFGQQARRETLLTIRWQGSTTAGSTTAGSTSAANGRIERSND